MGICYSSVADTMSITPSTNARNSELIDGLKLYYP